MNREFVNLAFLLPRQLVYVADPFCRIAYSVLVFTGEDSLAGREHSVHRYPQENREASWKQ